MIARRITYFGQPCMVACDALCGKAWGINSRPRRELSDDPDDYEFLADVELGDAPDDPGTYEGFHAKPTRAGDRLNKWCIRECERSVLERPGETVMALTPFDERRRNKPAILSDPPRSTETT